MFLFRPMRLPPRPLLAGLLLVLSCVPILNVTRPEAGLSLGSTDRDALIVLHVTPHTGVIVAGGECDTYSWAKNNFVKRQSFWSGDGYILMKANPTQGKEAYAVVAVRPERFTSLAEEKPFMFATVMWRRILFDRGTFLPGPSLLLSGLAADAQGGAIVWGEEDKGQFAYSPGPGMDMPTFTATAGSVTYVGALRVDASMREGAHGPPKSIAVTPLRSADDLPAVAKFMATHHPNVHVPFTYRPLQMVARDEATDN